MLKIWKKKFNRTPIVVMFAGKKYKVEPLALRDSQEWQGKVVDLLSQVPRYTKATSDNPEEFTSALQAMMLTGPATVVDLFFDYARGLDREEIVAIATEEEIAKAFEQVVQIAFYLTRSMVKVITTLGETEGG